MPHTLSRAVSSSRRTFLQLSAMTTVATLCKAPPASGLPRVPQQQLAADTQRPEFHLMPAAGWMNDPNGPIFAHGRYHMFCQHNPQAAVWGNISWAHMVSDDMIHWRHLPLAITPSPNSIDAYGIFSGSCFSVGRRVYAVYTATEVSDAAHATTRGKPDIRESQRLAWSDDPMLLHWTKDATAIVPLPPEDLHQVTGFRDPSIWSQDGFYYMTVGSGETGKGGCVLLYRSSDLKQWSYQHKLASAEWHGTVMDDKVASGEMWECPDFFALDGAHVLIYSTEGKVYWQSGKLGSDMRFHGTKSGLLDLGAYYAPKTQLDAHGNRILWGWIPERRPEKEYNAAGWSGVMSLPRVLHVDADGTLRMQVLPAVASLRGARAPVSRVDLVHRLTLRRANGEAHCTGMPGRDVTCILKNAADGSEIMRVSYDSSSNRFQAEGKSLQLASNDPVAIHLFVDGSVIEMVLSERTGYTKRFYVANAPDLAVEIHGASRVQAWQLKPISADRLTTPSTQSSQES